MTARRKSKPLRRPAQVSSVDPPGFGRREWLVCAGLALAVAAIYAPVATHGFVNWDDPEYVTNNPAVRGGLTLAGVRWAFTSMHAANWHPLTWLSHMLDVELYGMRAGWHHVDSVLLHIISSLLLFGWLRRTTGAVGRTATVAALFAVHPAHVESVAWVAERKDTLSTVFWMASLWAYTEYARRPSRWQYALVVATVTLGLMSKPMLVTLPFVFLLLDLWPLKRITLERSEKRGISLRRLVMEKVPLFALALASAGVTMIAQSRGGAVVQLEAYPLVLRFVNATISYVAYVREAFWPVGLAVVYPPRVPASIMLVALALATLVVVTVLAVRLRAQHPYVLVGWLWYVGTLVPVIGLVQVGSQPMADRYTYVPFVGLFVVVAWGVHDLVSSTRGLARVTPVAATIALVACAIVAGIQVRYWRDDLTLWRHALAVTGPNARAHNNLANALSDRGRVDAAIAHYRQAIAIKPDFGEAHSNLANSLASQGKSEEAAREYLAALRYRPNDPFAHNGLGSLLDEQGKVTDAIDQYRAALRIAPDMAEAHNNLGIALTREGRFDDAIGEFLEAIRANPSGANFHYNLGITLSQHGNPGEARRHLEAALQLDPRLDGARQALAALPSRP